MKNFKSKIAITLVLAFVLISMFQLNVQAAEPVIKHPAFTPISEEYAYSIIKEISSDKYAGRVSGTKGYTDAANFISKEFANIGLVPVGDNGSYLQKYIIDVAEFGSLPVLKINNKNLVFMQQFRVHGNSSSGNFNASELTYVSYGYPGEYSVDVKGKVVVLNGDFVTGKTTGIADRIIELKKKGAIGALIITPYDIKSYEKPLRFSDVGIPCFYISKEMASELGMEKETKPQTFKIDVSGSVTINRKTNQTSYNVLGMVAGRNTSKTIVISANLDGLGTTPNGTIYNSASMNASGVGCLAALAKYYNSQETKPAYNIVFAVFGSKFQENNGANYFVDSFKDIKKVIADITLFDVGGKSTKITSFTSPKNAYIYMIADSLGDVFDPNTSSASIGSRNMDSYAFERKGIPNIFVRASESEADSSTDKISNIDKGTLSKTMNYTNEMVFACVYNANLQNFDVSKVRIENLTEAGRDFYVYETEHFKFYYDTTNKKEFISEMVKYSESVYEEVMWWNYYPKMSGKARIYFANSYKETWKLSGRKDVGGESGGVQNPAENKVAIAQIDKKLASDLYLGCLAHEFNHNASTQKLKELQGTNLSDRDIDNEETSGSVYAYTFRGISDICKNVYSMYFTIDDFKHLKSSDQLLEEYNGENFKKIPFEEKSLLTHYGKLASIEYYIWFNYGRETVREIQYDIYYRGESTPIKNIIEQRTGAKIDSIISGWKQWMSISTTDSFISISEKFELVFPETEHIFKFKGINLIFNKKLKSSVDPKDIQIFDSNNAPIKIDLVELLNNNTMLSISSSSLINGVYTLKISGSVIENEFDEKLPTDINLKFIVKAN